MRIKHSAEIIIPALLAIAIASVARVLFFQTFFVPSMSMSPTIYAGDEVLIFKAAYTIPHTKIETSSVKRGDIVVFTDEKNEEYYIKRAVGLGGEEVAILDGQVYIDGVPLKEDYASLMTKALPQRLIVGKNEIFVMGDNRNGSEDSRYFGSIKESHVIGKAICVFAPLSNAHFLGKR